MTTNNPLPERTGGGLQQNKMKGNEQMKHYFVNDNVKQVKVFYRLRDAREFANTQIGEKSYLPGYLITSQDDEKTYFIESKDFNWNLTTEDIRQQARAALMRKKTSLRNAIFADVESVINFVKIAAIDNEEEILRRLCVFVLGGDKYRALKISYCCDDRDVAELCREVIKGTRVGKVVIETVNKKRDEHKRERARIEKLIAIG